MKTLIAVFLTSTCMVLALPPPHPAVLAVNHQEQSLPAHLRKPAIRNPHLWNVLPATSLLHPGESPVFDREADHITRKGIYSMLIHAGFIPRTHPNHWYPGQDRWKGQGYKHRTPHRAPLETELYNIEIDQNLSHPDHLQFL